MIVSLLLDGLLTNYLPFLPNQLSLFTPSFTLISIFLIYPFYRKEKKKYFYTVFILGFIYDLFYTNLLFYNAFIYLLLGLFISIVYKNLEISFFKNIIFLFCLIVLYECFYASLICLFHLVPITFEKLYYKISHTLILNIIYGEIVYFIIKLIPSKFKKISIN